MKRYYTGRKKITIPVSRNDFNKNPLRYIKHYLQYVSSINRENKEEADNLKEIYKGIQNIWNKVRLNSDTSNNNQVEINHIFRQVEFKKGFMVGNPIDYSLAVSDKKTDDLTYLQKYFKDSAKASKDIDKYEDLYVCGISEQFIIPKTYGFDSSYESPFELYNINVGDAFKVYSNDITKTPLFDVVISQVVDSNFSKRQQYEIYFINSVDNKTYYFVVSSAKDVVSTSFNPNFDNIKTIVQPYDYLPLIESELNKNRMGIVELVISIQDGLNAIHSNQIDDIIDFVNAYLVFENQQMGKKEEWEEKVKTFRKNRAISIKSNNPQLPAKVSLLKQTLQHTEINAFYELLKKEMYDIVAVPQSSGNVTSGGDTGEARILGNGWESSQNQAKVDVSYSLQFEYELLKKALKACREKSVKEIGDIYASDIDIKYSINMSNNILTKTQALQNLYDMHMPYEEALGVVGITSDTHGLAQKWAKFDEDAKTISMKMQQKNLGNDNANEDNNNNDISNNGSNDNTNNNK